MSECYCAKIEGGVVTQVIVCSDPVWAANNIGGEWVCTDGQLVGIGWQYVDGVFVQPPPVEPPEDI